MAAGSAAWQSVIETTVGAMGYEVVEVEMAPAGLLRVFIDHPEGIRMEDCEKVSRQLGHVLMVAEVDYRRLEISSPGLDRPLRKPADFERFAGWEVAVRLKRPLQGRRHYEGILELEPEGRFGLVLIENTPSKAVRGAGAKLAPAKAGAARRIPKGQGVPGKVEQAAPADGARKLVFALDEIDWARLVPKVAF